MVLSLDISTTTIGVALFSNDGKLLELTHFKPKLKPKPKNSKEVLYEKTDLFIDFIKDKYGDFNLDEIVVEAPIKGASRNVHTIAMLIKFNGMVCKELYNIYKIKPLLINTYDSRAIAWPSLMKIRTHKLDGTPLAESQVKKNKPVLFGGYGKLDSSAKKQIIWNCVNSKEKNINWVHRPNGDLRNECFDMADAYTCGLAYFNAKNQGIEFSRH